MPQTKPPQAKLTTGVPYQTWRGGGEHSLSRNKHICSEPCLALKGFWHMACFRPTMGLRVMQEHACLVRASRNRRSLDLRCQSSSGAPRFRGGTRRRGLPKTGRWDNAKQQQIQTLAEQGTALPLPARTHLWRLRRRSPELSREGRGLAPAVHGARRWGGAAQQRVRQWRMSRRAVTVAPQVVLDGMRQQRMSRRDTTWCCRPC